MGADSTHDAESKGFDSGACDTKNGWRLVKEDVRDIINPSDPIVVPGSVTSSVQDFLCPPPYIMSFIVLARLGWQ